MRQRGYVSRADKDLVKIIIPRESACGGGCASCGGCDDEKSITLELENTLNAEVGDYVVVESKSSTILKSAFIAYIMPLILMIIGLSIGMSVFKYLGYQEYEALGFLVGLVFLGVSYIILRYIDNKYFKDNDGLFEIIGIDK